MKKATLTPCSLLLVSALAAGVASANTDRYWSGNATLDTPTKNWATASGGASDAAWTSKGNTVFAGNPGTSWFRPTATTGYFARASPT